VQRGSGAGREVLRGLRQQARVGRTAAALLLAAATAALLTPPMAEVARFKPFWLDEGFEVAESCRHPYLALLVKGAPGQCSPSPLYYLAQRASVRSLSGFDERVAVGYRRVSLAAAALLLFATVAVLFARLGPPWGLAAAASLASQPLVVQYAAENRPYTSWLLLFALALLAGADAASRRWRDLGRGRRVALALSSLALSLVALPGALQAALVCALCGLAWRQGAEDRAEARASLRWSLALAAACAALGLYFAARSPCGRDEAGHLALARSDGAGLVWPVLSLLWAQDLAGHVGNALLAAGLLAALRPPRAPLSADDAPRARFARWLAVGVAAQLGLTLLLAAQVARAGYYFLPRAFLHLTVCRALGIAVGGWLVVDWLAGRISRTLRTAVWALASVLAVLAAAAAFSFERQEVEERRAMWTRTEAPCTDLDGPLIVDVAAGGTDWALAPNFLVRLGEAKRRCEAARSGPVRHVLVSAGGGFRLSSERLPGAVPLEQCGRPVSLER
jgi:hypothetical protein